MMNKCVLSDQLQNHVCTSYKFYKNYLCRTITMMIVYIAPKMADVLSKKKKNPVDCNVVIFV